MDNIKIKGKIEIRQPTEEQYAYFQPEITIEKEVAEDKVKEETRQMQEHFKEIYDYHQALKGNKNNPDAERFSKLPLDIRKLITLLTYDYCSKRNWGITKIKTDIMKLYNERLGDGVAAEIMNKIGGKK